MPMITCPECGKTVSDRINKCPNCGSTLLKKSDRYSQFYKSSNPKPEQQPEPQYFDERKRKPQYQKSSKNTALSISAMLISLMGLLTSFIAIAIASGNPKEVYVEKEVPVYQDVEAESKPELHQKDFDAAHVPSKNEITSETTIERQVVFSQGNIVITATGIDSNSSFIGPEIKFLIENNTENNLTVQARNVSVNGYMVDTTMSAEVSSGKKTNDSLTIDNSSLEECGIEDIAYIDFSFHIFNDDSWDDSIDTEMIHLETSNANRYIKPAEDKNEENRNVETQQQEEENNNVITKEDSPEGIKEEKIETSDENNDKPNNIFYVGDVLETKKIRLSYLSCGDYIDDNMFIEAGDNNKPIYFEFEFENIGVTDTSVGFYDFDCYADGYEARNSMCTADNAMTSIANLSPGRKMGGIVVFEVPQNAENIEIEYETNFWLQDKAIFMYK